MRNYLKSKGRKYWRICEGSYLRPTSIKGQDSSTSEADIDEWDEVNDVVAGLIGASCEGAPETLIRKLDLAKDCWDALRNAYHNRLSQRIDMLDAELSSLRQGSGMNGFEDFITSIENLCDKLSAVDVTVSTQRKFRVLLNGLKPDLEAKASVLSYDRDKLQSETFEDSRDSTRKWDEFYNRAVNHLRLAHEKQVLMSKAQETQERVMFADRNGRNSKQGGHRHQSQDKGQKESRECYYCHKIGHLAINCRKKSADIKSGKFAKSNYNRNIKNAGKDQDNRSESANMASNWSFAMSDCGLDTDKWIFDSGATTHATSQIEVFSSLSKTVEDPLKTAGGGELPIIGRGTVKIRCRIEDNKYNVIELKNVAYCPGIKVNLLSLERVQENPDIIVELSKKGGEIRHKSGTIICRGIRNNKNTTLDGTVIKQERANVVSHKESAQLWHNRLGHIGVSTMKDTAKVSKGMDHLDEKDFKELSTTTCNECMIGKQSRQPFRQSTTVTTKPLQLIHSDLVGKMQVNTYDGKGYVFVMIDDYTKMTFVALLERKSEAFEYFQRWRTAVELQWEAKVKILRTDGGGEYCNQAFRNYLSTHGIQHETTNRYTPQQNGVAERSNLTLFNMVRAMLAKAKCDKNLWGEAVRFAANVKNVTSSTTIPGKTPYELWTGSKADLTDLKTFGCTAYAQIPVELRQKLDDRSKKLVYVGKTPGTKGHRLIDPATMKIIQSRDVLFDESEFPFIELATKTAKENEDQIDLEEDAEQVGEMVDSVGDTTDRQESTENETEESQMIEENEENDVQTSPSTSNDIEDRIQDANQDVDNMEDNNEES
ncbi:hypothetical protein CBS101457_006774 [Exobasidium rhododendri]|nr:hypothetical protein CBS101457_006774 [Exobasidium rhododendri]